MGPKAAIACCFAASSGLSTSTATIPETAPVAIRECLAIDEEDLPKALTTLNQCRGVSESYILSTCNRTELLCGLDSRDNRAPIEWLIRYHGLGEHQVLPYLYALPDETAVRHVLRVASGLDSMVIGEPQILGQMKTAYHAAMKIGTVGKLLNRLLQHSFRVAKPVRSDTEIGTNPVSIAFAAVRLAQQIHGDLDSKLALLIGPV